MADIDPKFVSVMSKAQSALEVRLAFAEVLKVLETKAITDGVRAYRTGGLTAERAKEFIIEIAAYRNIARELEQRVEAGKKAEARAFRELQS